MNTVEYANKMYSEAVKFENMATNEINDHYKQYALTEAKAFYLIAAGAYKHAGMNDESEACKSLSF